jgi:hypothetical protein
MRIFLKNKLQLINILAMVINENFQDMTLIDDLFNSAFDLKNHELDQQTVESINCYSENEV